MKNKWMGIALVAGLLPLGITAAQAADVITPFDDATGTGPWTLSSTEIVPGDILSTTDGGVELAPSASFTFAQLSSLSANFTDVEGGADGGSPRISVGIDNGGSESFIHIYLGTSPDFNDSDPATFTTAYSGFDVIGNNDSGRYDTSQFAGGDVDTTYAGALALLGSYHVDEFDFVVDGGWAANGTQIVDLDSINYAVAGVPEPATWAMLLIGFGAVGFAMRGRRKALSATA